MPKVASASQCEVWLRCQSRWWWERVGGYRQPETEAMRRGKRLHKLWERYLTLGEVPQASIDPDERDMFLSTLPNLPQPGTIPDWLVERRFDDPSYPLPLVGYIDLVYPEPIMLPDGRPALKIVDHKTTSNFKYAKTAEVLFRDPQACAYVSQVARLVGWTGPIVFELIYAKTRPPFQSHVVSVVFEPANVIEAEAFLKSTVSELAAGQNLAITDVAHNLEACDDYRSKENPDGCPHRVRCFQIGRKTLDGFDIMFGTNEQLEAITMSDPMGDLLRAAPPLPQPSTNALPQPAWPFPNSAPTPQPTPAIQHAAMAPTPTPQPTPAIQPQTPAAWVPPTTPAIGPVTMADLRRYRPDILNANGDLAQQVEAARRDHRMLVAQLGALAPDLAQDWREAQDNLYLGELRNVCQSGIGAIKGEILALNPQRPADQQVAEAHFAGMSLGDLAKVVMSQRGKIAKPVSAPAHHAINSPEGPSPTPPADKPAKAKKAKAEGDKPPRGLRLPATAACPEGKFISQSTWGDLEPFFLSQGIAPPTGKGKVFKARSMATRILLGQPLDEPAPAAPAPIPQAQPGFPLPIQQPIADPHSALRQKLEAQVLELAAQLGASVTTTSLSDEQLANVHGTLKLQLEERNKRRGFVLYVGCAPQKTPSQNVRDYLAHTAERYAQQNGRHVDQIAPEEWAMVAKWVAENNPMPEQVHCDNGPVGTAIANALMPFATEAVVSAR